MLRAALLLLAIGMYFITHGPEEANLGALPGILILAFMAGAAKRA
jgi:hypothetical protein